MENRGNPDGVTVSLEIEGQYEDVIARLKSSDSDSEQLGPFLLDVRKVLNTVVRTGGGTRSVIAERLPEDMVVNYDAEAVVSLLTVLQEYGFVELEGNTWKPGPAYSGEQHPVK